MTAPAHRSPLGPAITCYIDRQRSLGFKYDNEARILHALDGLLAQHGHSDLTADSFAARALTLEQLKPQGRRKRMQIVRKFTLYRRRTAPDCFVPDPAQFPAPRPCILSQQQILTLLQQAGQLKSAADSPLRAAVNRLAVVLLYTAGLRRGELVRLCVGDNDPSRHTLLVRLSNFRKSRAPAMPGGNWTPTSGSGSVSRTPQVPPCSPTARKRRGPTPDPDSARASASCAGTAPSSRPPEPRRASMTCGTPMQSMCCCAAIGTIATRRPFCRPCRGPWAMSRWPRPRTI